MSNDSISRRAAINIGYAVAEVFSRVLDDDNVVGIDREKHEFGLGLIEAYIAYVKELPTAEPEQKKGKWIDDTFCSECGWTHEVESGFIGSVKQFNFCPNCGSYNREVENE